MSLMELALQQPSARERFGQMQSLMGLVPGAESGMGTLMPSTSSGSIESRARQYFSQRGYTPQDWRKVQYIIGNESDWDPTAVNPSSGAAGIAQNIQGFGPNYSRNDPMEQIRWLYNYLDSHDYSGYGTGIDAAYQHKVDTGWY